MSKIQVWRSNVENARDRASLTPAELQIIDEMIGANTGNIPLEVERLPMNFVRALLEDGKLKPNQRAVLTMYVHGLDADDLDCENIYALRVASAVEFGSAIGTMSRQRPNAELLWNGRWYPVIVQSELREDEQKLAKHVFARIIFGLGRITYTVEWPVDPSIFVDDAGTPIELTILQVLERLGFRRLQTAAGAFNLRLLNAERLAATPGTQVWVKGSVLELGRRRVWWASSLTELPLGTPEMPRRAIVEPILDADESGEHSYFGAHRAVFGENVSRLPLVRLFSLDTKGYIFADIDDVEAYEYDESALARLYLPGGMKSVLQKVFETPTDQLFGDLIRGKHGGIVILACGHPGVGKTLTAEVYAEMTRRPLYVLEFGELGTTVEAIEHNLERIFARVVRWNAVLQFDECEIFLAQRNNDLERSAIVGIFLRMLDYYEGLLFLTTNRPEVLDDAIRSRVMLRLEYPDLDAPARAHVWGTMFEAAGLSLIEGTFRDLSTPEINGRQIRNLVRLVRILHPDGRVTASRVLELMRYGSK